MIHWLLIHVKAIAIGYGLFTLAVFVFCFADIGYDHQEPV